MHKIPLLASASRVCLLLAALVVIGLGLSGCSKDAASIGSSRARLFQSADPQIKQQWDVVNAAIQTNGFVTAMMNLSKLQQAALNPEQLKAVQETATAVSDQMYAAANKGDAAAKAAIVTLREMRNR